MSIQQENEDRVHSGPSEDIKKGKKRKRRGGDGPHGVGLKKGAGKLIKLDDSDNEDKTATTGPAVATSVDPESPAKSLKQKLKSEKIEKPSSPNVSQEKPARRIQPTKRPNETRPARPIQGPPTHLLKKRDALLPVRKALPIWPQADAIRAALKKNNALVLTGETGSGKSTQVPQFLLNEPWCRKCIAITQPRRVAAISLARRVADEMGSFMGSQSPAAKVGYSVRFDNATGPNTKVKFLTEGMLLQEMLRDPTMSQYSAVVVDEVHERSVNVDLILGFLKNLVADLESGSTKRKDPLKVVIMSATADVESLVKFFENSATAPPPEQNIAKETELSNTITRQVSTCYVEGRQYPVKTIYLPEPSQDWVESALKLIFQIHYKEPLPGDILVFLTGQDTIEALEKLVNDYAEGMDRDVPKVSKLCYAGDLLINIG